MKNRKGSIDRDQIANKAGGGADNDNPEKYKLYVMYKYKYCMM